LQSRIDRQSGSLKRDGYLAGIFARFKELVQFRFLVGCPRPRRQS
jgi:hypothetical protein